MLKSGQVEISCLIFDSRGGGGEATRSGTEKRCSHNLQSGQSAGKSAAFQGGGVFSHDFIFGFEL